MAVKYVKKIGFIGAGKVGTSLGRHISERGQGSFSVAGYFSRDMATARSAAVFTKSAAFETMEALAEHSDMLLLTVPDGSIEEVWTSLSRTLSGDRTIPSYIGHCSGSQSSETFSVKPAGLFCGSIHPLLAVYDRKKSYKDFQQAYFTIEGDTGFTDFAASLLTALGNPFSLIDASSKQRYHAASVFVSNLVCALAYTGTEVLKSCGLDDEFAESAWRALFMGNAEHIAAAGPVRALTGPIERGDAATVAKHIQALSGDTRDIYLLLSQTLIDVARQKNPERDYSELAALLFSQQGDVS